MVFNDVATAPSVLAAPGQVTPITRVGSSSSNAVATLIEAGMPMVITGTPEAELGRLLTTRDLRTAFGDVSVTVGVSNSGSFRHDATSTPAKTVSFSDFVDYVESTDHRGSERLYLSQFPLDSIPSVAELNLTAPRHIPADSALTAENLWFGPAGTVSPLHIDRSHNLLVQHAGRKHIVIFAPEHSNLMMPGPKNSNSPHVSSRNIVTSHSTIDLSDLPAPCLEAVIEPGDVLFIPAFWWHNVASLDGAISTNYWWRPPVESCLVPSFFRMLSSRAVYDNPALVHRWVDVSPHRLDTAFCEFLLREGHVFGAAALASALVAAFCRRSLLALGLSDNGSESPSDFSHSLTVVTALATHGTIDDAKAELLRAWLAVAAETASAPDPIHYSTERTAVIAAMVSRLDAECGQLLSL